MPLFLILGNVLCTIEIIGTLNPVYVCFTKKPNKFENFLFFFFKFHFFSFMFKCNFFIYLINKTVDCSFFRISLAIFKTEILTIALQGVLAKTTVQLKLIFIYCHSEKN